MERHNGNDVTRDRSGSNPDRSIPVDITDSNGYDFEDQIARLNAQLAADKARRAHELDVDWARAQQNTSIALFRVFAIILCGLFIASLIVLLFSCDVRQIHVATVLIEIISAAVVAGYLGYMLAKPFEHRR